jgi:hypothetical protein
MSILWTIIIGLGASIIGGVISSLLIGLLMMRKTTHENKRLYARQMSEDFELMSTLLLSDARDYLESLGYDVKGMELYKPNEHVEENQAIVNRIRKEFDIDEKRKKYRYNAQKMVAKAEELTDVILHDTTGFKNFFDKYHLQASYFDHLYKASSKIELILFWRNELHERTDIEYIRICISNITVYLLDTFDEILQVDAEIVYYCNAKPWT